MPFFFNGKLQSQELSNVLKYLCNLSLTYLFFVCSLACFYFHCPSQWFHLQEVFFITISSRPCSFLLLSPFSRHS